MALVIASRSLRFRAHDGSAHSVMPSVHPQNVPDQFIKTPQFAAATKSGWVGLVADRPVEDLPAAATLSGFEPTELMAELQRRGVLPQPPTSVASTFTIADVSDEDLATELSVRIGIPVEDILEGIEDAKHRKALGRSSGIDGDSGDWTQFGDGTGYPGDAPAGSIEDAKAAKASGKGKPAPATT